jgi:hypothetical protein
MMQAAVPKFIQLQLQPASGTTLVPNSPNPVQQRIVLNNADSIPHTYIHTITRVHMHTKIRTCMHAHTHTYLLTHTYTLYTYTAGSGHAGSALAVAAAAAASRERLLGEGQVLTAVIQVCAFDVRLTPSCYIL